MYSVLIVEDEALIRQGLIRSIRWDELKMTLTGRRKTAWRPWKFSVPGRWM